MTRKRKHEVELTNAAHKDLRKLRSHVARILGQLAVLEDNPFAGDKLSGDLSFARRLDFSLPGGAYRAAYMVHPDKPVCVVFMIGPRENFYKRAKERARHL